MPQKAASALFRVQFILSRTTKKEALEILENVPRAELATVVADLLQLGAVYLKRQQEAGGSELSRVAGVATPPRAPEEVNRANTSPAAAPNYLLDLGLSDSDLTIAWGFQEKSTSAASTPSPD